MRQGFRLAALKAFDVRRRECLDVIEVTKKVATPETAPKFAVGHRFQSECRFLRHCATDCLILDRFQISGADLGRLTFGARLLDFLWSQRAAERNGGSVTIGSLPS